MKSWKVKEIVIMSVISIVFAVVYLLFTHFGNVLAGMFGPIAYEPIYGIWFIVSVIAAYMIRKPGAALVSEIIAALVECLLGNPSGPMVIVIGIVQGLGAEAVFLATRWKAYSLPVLMLAGMGSSVASFIYDLFVSGYAAYSPGYLLIMLVIRPHFRRAFGGASRKSCQRLSRLYRCVKRNGTRKGTEKETEAGVRTCKPLMSF